MGARGAGGVAASGRRCVPVGVVALQLGDQAGVGHRAVDLNERAPAVRQEDDGVRDQGASRGGVGDLEAPVHAFGRLRLVKGDDGVDQGEAVLAQARLRGRAVPGGPSGRRREVTGRGGFSETGGGAVPVTLLGAVGPADQGVGAQVAQRAAYVVGALLVRQQQCLELVGRGQAQLGKSQEDLTADLGAGPGGTFLRPGRYLLGVTNRGDRGVATGRGRSRRGLISDNRQAAAGSYRAGSGARRVARRGAGCRIGARGGRRRRLGRRNGGGGHRVLGSPRPHGAGSVTGLARTHRGVRVGPTVRKHPLSAVCSPRRAMSVMALDHPLTGRFVRGRCHTAAPGVQRAGRVLETAAPRRQSEGLRERNVSPLSILTLFGATSRSAADRCRGGQPGCLRPSVAWVMTSPLP